VVLAVVSRCEKQSLHEYIVYAAMNQAHQMKYFSVVAGNHTARFFLSVRLHLHPYSKMRCTVTPQIRYIGEAVADVLIAVTMTYSVRALPNDGKSELMGQSS
jgi:hypothetical protein